MENNYKLFEDIEIIEVDYAEVISSAVASKENKFPLSTSTCGFVYEETYLK